MGSVIYYILLVPIILALVFLRDTIYKEKSRRAEAQTTDQISQSNKVIAILSGVELIIVLFFMMNIIEEKILFEFISNETYRFVLSLLILVAIVSSIRLLTKKGIARFN
jgi:hypothetical protein